MPPSIVDAVAPIIGIDSNGIIFSSFPKTFLDARIEKTYNRAVAPHTNPTISNKATWGAVIVDGNDNTVSRKRAKVKPLTA
jgi:hypothetical protein